MVTLKRLFPWIAALALVWILQFTIIGNLDPYYFQILMYSGINVVLAVSLNLVNGFTGQFSMGHAGFMSVGGYASAALSLYINSHYPALLQSPLTATLVFILCLICGGLLAAFSGYLVGLPSLRLKGDYLAIVTLGFGEIIRVIILNIDAIGGARGMSGIPQLSSFGAIYTFAILTPFVIWRLMKSRFGRSFLSVREDEIAAEAMGVNTTQAKVRAFVIGAFFAGIAGGLFGHFLRYLNPQIFDFNKSFEVIIMVVLGGMGSITGSIVAAFILTIIKEALRPLQEITKLDFRMIIYSLFLIILMLNRPNGIFGNRELPDFFKKKKHSAKSRGSEK